MSEKVIVIILKGETKPGDSHIKNLKHWFNDAYFHTHIMDLHNHDETTKFKLALRWAKQEYRDHPCLIIKDSSLIHIDVKDYIKSVIKLDVDLFFLCKYQDQCHQYMNVNHHPHLKYTFSSCATQAILFNTKARNVILKELVNLNIQDCLLKHCQNKNLTAVVCTPNIVHFDINLATSNEDFYKLNECAIIKLDEINKTDTTNIVWLFLLVILILFLVLIAPYFKYYKQLL